MVSEAVVYSQLNRLPFARRCGQVQVLVCRCDTQNRHDPFAVATCKGTTVVGHVNVL